MIFPTVGSKTQQNQGRTKRKCFVCMRETAVIARASCATVSEHAMYAWVFLVRCGQRCLTSVMSHCSENQANDCDVLIQPPMPTVVPSAIASAAARQHNCGACLTVRSWSCHARSRRRASEEQSGSRCEGEFPAWRGLPGISIEAHAKEGCVEHSPCKIFSGNLLLEVELRQ